MQASVREGWALLLYVLVIMGVRLHAVVCISVPPFSNSWDSVGITLLITSSILLDTCVNKGWTGLKAFVLTSIFITSVHATLLDVTYGYVKGSKKLGMLRFCFTHSLSSWEVLRNWSDLYQHELEFSSLWEIGWHKHWIRTLPMWRLYNLNIMEDSRSWMARDRSQETDNV